MNWKPDGTGVQSAGDIGGDIQRGETYSVRFVRPDKPGSLYTVTFYAVEYDHQCPGEFVVQEQTEWMVCEDPRDPGGTEIWSDMQTRDISEHVWYTQAEAEKEAREFAEAELRPGSSDIGWDGEPDWGR